MFIDIKLGILDWFLADRYHRRKLKKVIEETDKRSYKMSKETIAHFEKLIENTKRDMILDDGSRMPMLKRNLEIFRNVYRREMLRLEHLKEELKINIS